MVLGNMAIMKHWLTCESFTELIVSSLPQITGPKFVVLFIMLIIFIPGTAVDLAAARVRVFRGREDAGGSEDVPGTVRVSEDSPLW